MIRSTIVALAGNGWRYEQVCLAECSKLAQILLANLLIARVSSWHGKLSTKLYLKHETKFLLK